MPLQTLSGLTLLNLATDPTAIAGEIYYNTTTKSLRWSDGTLWYNTDAFGWLNVTHYGVTTANADTTNLANLNTLLSTTAASGATIYFPPGTYQISGTVSIPSGRHYRIWGAGINKTIIQTTSGTLDMFDTNDNQNEFKYLSFTSSVTRTAGAVINSGNNNTITVSECSFTGHYENILFTNSTNSGVNSYVQDCTFTNAAWSNIHVLGPSANVVVRNCIMTSSPATTINIEVEQCQSMLVDSCQISGGTYNMYIAPTSPNSATAIYCVNTLFQNAGSVAVAMLGTGVVENCKFTQCLFSSNSVGAQIAGSGTTLPTRIDFIGCTFYGLGSANTGLSINGCKEVTVTGCNIAGWSVGGISTSASTGSVTRFLVTGCRIGPTGSIAANGTGVTIGSGTYGSYSVTGNDLTGNTTSPLTDNGTVASPNNKILGPNLGALPSGSGASVTTLSVTTAEVLTSQMVLPKAGLRVGTTFRGKIFLSDSASAGTLTLNMRIGVNGTTGDTVAAAITPVNTVSADSYAIEFLLTVRTLGSSGTALASGYAIPFSVAPTSTNQVFSAAPAAVTVNKTVANSLTLWASVTAGTVSVWNSVLEVVQY
jgi:hypothetical protein